MLPCCRCITQALAVCKTCSFKSDGFLVQCKLRGGIWYHITASCDMRVIMPFHIAFKNLPCSTLCLRVCIVSSRQSHSLCSGLQPKSYSVVNEFIHRRVRSSSPASVLNILTRWKAIKFLARFTSVNGNALTWCILLFHHSYLSHSAMLPTQLTLAW